MNIDTSSTKLIRLPPRLHGLATLAALLERLEREPSTASPQQYQQVARQIGRVLAETDPDPSLDALLDLAPASAQIYENIRYEHAGLCREPLEQALNGELAARAAIANARLPQRP